MPDALRMAVAWKRGVAGTTSPLEWGAGEFLAPAWGKSFPQLCINEVLRVLAYTCLAMGKNSCEQKRRRVVVSWIEEALL